MDNKKNNLRDEADMNSEISKEERNMLDESQAMGTSSDEENLRRARVDNVDDEGEVLNVHSEEVNVTGEDLDVPGSELDDANEEIGEEDEENNSYSRADTE